MAEIRLTTLNVTVSEEDEEVMVCFELDGLLARNVVATAETGPKAGASNQATGITNQ